MPFWLISAASVLLLSGLAVLLYRRRPPEPLWPIAFACQILALLWVVGDLWASHSSSLGEKQIALAVLFTGSILLPPLWWETCRRYIAWHGLGRPWLESPLVRLPLWFGGLAWLAMLANPWHGQFIEPVVGGPNDYQWGVTLVAFTHWGIGLATCALCVWAAFRHRRTRVRRQMAILASATLAPIVLNLAHLSLPNMPREDAVAIGLGLTSLAVMYGVIRRRLFNLAPVALSQILRSDPSGVLLLERGGRLLFWNPAAEKLLEGVALEPDTPVLSLLASRLENPSTDEPLADTHSLIELLSSGGGFAGSMTFCYRSGGGERWLRLGATPIRGRRRRIAAVCIRIQDAASEERPTLGRRSREERMREAEAATTFEFLADGVAHDFNNILATIDCRARLALEDATRGLPVRRHLAAIVKASSLAKDLTQQVRTVAAHAQSPRGPVELSPLVDELRDLLSDSLPPNAKLRTQLARRLPVVEADATQLSQVVLNLVKNAGEAIGDAGGEVVVSTSQVTLEADDGPSRAGRPFPGTYVQLDVADDGSGLSPDQRERVFDASFSTRGQGRGLGLAIVRRIVESHGGTVTVECDAGSGARFRVWLPVRSR